MTTSRVERSQFRTVLGHFGTGVVVLTGVAEGEPLGFTCQSFMSLSLDPPLVAVAPGKRSRSWPRIAASGRFGVTVLTDRQEAVARNFATSGKDKFVGVGWSKSPAGQPWLSDALAWIDCEVAATHDAGDHRLIIGRVTGLEAGAGEPLVFYRGGYGGFQA